MAKTLARILEVPFSMSDCTPLTQAGYIGEDAEVVVQRLLAAASYDVTRAEHGIICLDEIDKIATAKVSHGKDVSGEGVQQALLKIIEGTTLQIQAKQERGSGSNNGRQQSNMPPSGFPSHGHLGNGAAVPPTGGGGGGGKNEVFNVRTDNILFICAGAFNGLHKLILDRISRGSIGFGANVRVKNIESLNSHDTMLRGEDELFKKHLPFFTSDTPQTSEGEPRYNVLDLVEPQDLQKFGLIPEFVGRIPVSCALSSLDEEALVRVLTEPRNALLRQYEQLFSLSGIELRFTNAAMRVVAKDASGMGTGARGLRTVLERLLGEAMFEAPGEYMTQKDHSPQHSNLKFVGSPTKHILINEAVAQRKNAPIYLARGQQGTFHSLIASEEEEWEHKMAEKRGGHSKDAAADGIHNFQEYSQKGIAVGQY